MTRFLDVAAIRRLVASVGLEALIISLAEYLQDDFVRWEQFVKTPRTANFFPNGVLELMPISDKSLYSFKYVSGHPRNVLKKVPTIMGFSVLAEGDTGLPLLIAEATICTAIRTAAISALVGRALAPVRTDVMALIGCGAQSEFQAIAFKGLLGVREVRVFDIDPLAVQKFARNMARIEGLNVIVASSPPDAVEGADIITLITAAKTHAAVLSPEMVKPGVHINAVGGDSPGKTELHPGIIDRSTVFVEYEPQTRHEGDVQQMTPDFEVVEIWKVLANLHPGRQSDHEVTIFDSVGFALEDFSTMRFLRDIAERDNLGADLDLIATPAEPKDLYGFVMGER